MSNFTEGFQEHWAAHLVRRMEEEIAAALRAPDVGARRYALGNALDLGKEARLRIQAKPTHDAAEREGLSHLQNALDQVQAVLNAFDPCDDTLVRDAHQHADRAAEDLSRST